MQTVIFLNLLMPKYKSYRYVNEVDHIIENTYFIGTRKYVLRMNMIIPDFTVIVYVRQV